MIEEVKQRGDSQLKHNKSDFIRICLPLGYDLSSCPGMLIVFIHPSSRVGLPQFRAASQVNTELNFLTMRAGLAATNQEQLERSPTHCGVSQEAEQGLPGFAGQGQWQWHCGLKRKHPHESAAVSIRNKVGMSATVEAHLTTFGLDLWDYVCVCVYLYV